MADSSAPDISGLLRRFAVTGELLEARPYGAGHINATYLVTLDHHGARARYILQRVNTGVFKDPAAVMENIARITAHLHAKFAAAGVRDGARRGMTFLPACAGGNWVRAEDGGAWRLAVFIERARTLEIADSPGAAFEAAKAFAWFQALLADLPGNRLHETIPGFHDTPERLKAFERAVKADAAGRAAGCAREIAFALDQREWAATLATAYHRGLMPERVTHNDTKINNVLLDEDGTGLCVIDLDTVMPGLSLHDFADLARSTLSLTAEDEPDTAKVRLRLDYFAALARGYLVHARAFLTRAELDLLHLSPIVITYEQALRFLKDHLEGDAYYRIHRPGQNLDRCRTQLRLVELMLEKRGEMERLAREACAS